MSASSSSLPPYLDPQGRHRGRRSARAGFGRLAMVLASLLSASLLVGAGYFWYEARGIDNAGQRRTVAVGVAPTRAQHDAAFDDSAQNILVTGNDDRTNLTTAEAQQLHVGKDGGSMATDTMLIVHIPADGSKATLISLPRDSYVDIPGFKMAKLNAAYIDGYQYNAPANASVADKQTAGINLLLKTVTNLTGLRIDHYVQVSLIGFVRISDAINGVPIDLCHNVDDTVAHDAAEGVGGGSGLKLSKGKHLISGITALEFVRQRHNLAGGDLDRIKRQQYFITAAFRQIEGIGVITELNSIRNALTNSIVVDTGLHLFDLARQMANLNANNIIGRTIPTTPARLSDGTEILQVDPAKVQNFIAGILTPKPITTPATTPTSAAKSTAISAPAKKPAAIDSGCIN